MADTTLRLEKTPVVPNAVFVPMVLIQTGILNGKLVTSCQIHLAAAKQDDAGLERESWLPTGQTEMIHIPDNADLAKQPLACAHPDRR